jgi:hypothetical protein
MEPMDYFERFPWLLVPIIIITVEVWQVLKSLVRRTLGRQQTEAVQDH